MMTRCWWLLVAVVLVGTACSSDGDPSSAPETTTTVDAGADDPLALPFLHAEPDPVDGGRIFDDRGREVLLRGVNVNAFNEYWSGNEFPTVFPFTEDDAVEIAGFGWNTVRLLFSWSRVEPQPGEYDEDYLDELAGAVDLLAEQGIYTILDSHQDAWGATLAARTDEVCDGDMIPANGWDGAPGWATLVGDDVPRCTVAGIRETSPAVVEAWEAFWANEEGPGGVGIRTRYAEMFGHVAERFADQSAVAGYDLLNEPGAFSDEAQQSLADLYSDALVEIRAGEEAGGGPPHLVLFEPSAAWSSNGEGPPPDWDRDDDVVYSPHIYTGAFTGAPITRDALQVAVEEAKLFGGAPVLTGEWGTAFDNHHGTQRVGPDGDDYFLLHQGWQDELHISATIWTWRESCGDPHKVSPNQTEVPRVAGPVEVDCTTNEITGPRPELIDDLLRAYPRAAPGGIAATVYDPETGEIEVSGSGAEAGEQAVVFYPSQKHGAPTASGEGLDDVTVIDGPDGTSYITATTTGADWTLRASP